MDEETEVYTITDLRRKAPGFSHGNIRRFVFLVFGRVSSFRI